MSASTAVLVSIPVPGITGLVLLPGDATAPCAAAVDAGMETSGGLRHFAAGSPRRRKCRTQAHFDLRTRERRRIITGIGHGCVPS